MHLRSEISEFLALRLVLVRVLSLVGSEHLRGHRCLELEVERVFNNRGTDWLLCLVCLIFAVVPEVSGLWVLLREVREEVRVIGEGWRCGEATVGHLHWDDVHSGLALERVAIPRKSD